MKVGDLVRDKAFPEEHGLGLIYEIKKKTSSAKTDVFYVYWSRLNIKDVRVLPEQIEKIN